ncbi:type II secretion system F family protein [Candidatus Nitronereus thalassa]|uniref:Type II secretion system F family protein n=1 Tax=Candidatus Nitronereus thalassa TaxID=3020898 RepID=A0ABU3K7M7_9BACT|nr:type II secretion system F family protein [Candidatus Nitronereus thalassa]MDT7042367.1 type II secretion system F family protein [Candidatus Nitronereus thalassa]
MVKFAYRAVDAQGQPVEGFLSASNMEALQSQLEGNGLWLVEAKESKTGAGAQKKTRFNRAKRQLLIVFGIHMNSLLSAGVQVSPAIKGFADQATDPQFKKVMLAIWKRIETGVPLHEALKEHPSYFPEEMAHLVQAGEESGTLADTFGELRRYLEWVDRMIGDVRQATIYPSLVLGGLFLFMILLFTFVIPRFSTVLVSLKVPLPLPTIVIMHASDLLVATWMYWGTALLLIPIVVLLGRNSPEVGYQLDALKLKLPIFGEVVRMLVISRFAQNFGVLFRSGVPILRCLKLCQSLVGNRVVEKALIETEKGVSEGKTLSACLSRYSVFPPMVLQMVTVGESSGRLGQTMANVSDYYNEEIPRRMKRVFGLVEPLVTVGLIVLLGFVAVSIFLPMMSLVGGIR